MKTKAVRMYGAMDLRLEEFELPQIKEDEILVKVMSDSICLSTYKLVEQGKRHKKAPKNIDTNPIIIGHEFSGVIAEVGEKWKDRYKVGQKFALQPALNYTGNLKAPGYSFEFFGGACTYCIIPAGAIEHNCFMPYDGESFFEASLGEPMSCIIGGYRGNFHTIRDSHNMISGTKADGNIIIIGGCGPMGLGAVTYGIQFENRPKRIVVTDISDERIENARQRLPESKAAENGVELIYINTAKVDDPVKTLMDLTDGQGYDDVFVYVASKPVVEMADRLLAYDGCLNCFAGPIDNQFRAEVNMYNVHYMGTHMVGTSGGNNDDLMEANRLSAQGKIEPAVMVTHVGGIDSIAETTLNLPKIPGGKKLSYTQFDMPLTAIEDFEKLGETDPLFKKLDEVCKKNRGLWNGEAEKILFEHFHVEVC